jgi:hypothetical protein
VAESRTAIAPFPSCGQVAVSTSNESDHQHLHKMQPNTLEP